MNKLSFLLAGLLSLGCLAAEEDKDPLDAWFKEVRGLATSQTKDNVEMAGDSEAADELVPLEKASGKEWEGMIDYVAASEDRELKIRLLRLEFYFALTGAYYELEEGGGKLAQLAARAKIARYKSIIKQLDTMLAGGGEEAVEPDKAAE